MSDLEFVDELPPLERGGRHGMSDTMKARIDALRGRPGQWARWPTKTAASNIRKILGSEFEVCMRRGVCYVRYITPEAQRGSKVSCRGCGAMLDVSPPYGKTEREAALGVHRQQSRTCDQIIGRSRRGR